MLPHLRFTRNSVKTLFTASVSVLSAVLPVSADADPNLPFTVQNNYHISGATAVSLLNKLPVQGKSDNSWVDRDRDFGVPWVDPAINGGSKCNLRDTILARDMTHVVYSPKGCLVLYGILYDPYSGFMIQYRQKPGNPGSETVQVDHIVSLEDAWKTGADLLTQQKRVDFANDPLNLIAVGITEVRDRGGKDASEWLPSNVGLHCAYLARQVEVKTKYNLWVTPAEKNTLSQILSKCTTA